MIEKLKLAIKYLEDTNDAAPLADLLMGLGVDGLMSTDFGEEFHQDKSALLPFAIKSLEDIEAIKAKKYPIVLSSFCIHHFIKEEKLDILDALIHFEIPDSYDLLGIALAHPKIAAAMITRGAIVNESLIKRAIKNNMVDVCSAIFAREDFNPNIYIWIYLEIFCHMEK